MEMMISEEKTITFGRQGPSRERIIAIMILAVAMIIFIVGVALIAVAANGEGKGEGGFSTKAATAVPTEKAVSTEKTVSTVKTVSTDKAVPSDNPAKYSKCEYSEEVKRVRLGKFLDKVKSTYYKLHPYEVYDDPDVTPERIKVEYVAYDPTPSMIETRTNTSLALLGEINNKSIITTALKPRERKVVAQVKHFLKHAVGKPFDANYYAGDWMMGPNKRCWQEICYIGKAVQNGLGHYFKPYNVSDVELIETKLSNFQR